MDVVEVVAREGPGLGAVFDFTGGVVISKGQRNGKRDYLQSEIRWNPGWLDGRQVGAKHFCVRKFIGEVAGRLLSAGMPSGGKRVSHMAQIPVPVPTSSALLILPF